MSNYTWPWVNCEKFFGSFWSLPGLMTNDQGLSKKTKQKKTPIQIARTNCNLTVCLEHWTVKFTPRYNIYLCLQFNSQVNSKTMICLRPHFKEIRKRKDGRRVYIAYDCFLFSSGKAEIARLDSRYASSGLVLHLLKRYNSGLLATGNYCGHCSSCLG